jgi:hypothetical protein
VKIIEFNAGCRIAHSLRMPHDAEAKNLEAYNEEAEE